MPFLIVSVLCSVLVSVLLKLAQRRGVCMPQVVAWNYVAATALSLGLLRPPLAAWDRPDLPWAALLLLSVLLPAIFLLMAASVRVAGIVRTDVAQRLSLVLSLGAAFLFFGEAASGLKLAGLGLGLVAIVGIVTRNGDATGEQERSIRGLLLPLAVLCGYAAIDILLKLIALSGTPFALSLLLAFAGALVAMALLLGWRRARYGERLTSAALVTGLLVGAANFGNILFYVRAHRALPDNPAVIFASMNLGVVILGTLVGTLGFGERLGRLNKLGLGLAVIAIGMIALSLHSGA